MLEMPVYISNTTPISKETYKLACFEYMLDRFIEWDKDYYNRDEESPESFTKLKVIKLNFFASAALANDDNEGLLKIFDKFYAMKYGHVESDILSNCDRLSRYYFNDNILIKRESCKEIEINTKDKELINNSISKLKFYNNDLINYTSSQLVNLSHLWYSWKILFTKNRRSNSILINPYIIQTEPKIFELSYAF